MMRDSLHGASSLPIRPRGLAPLRRLFPDAKGRVERQVKEQQPREESDWTTLYNTDMVNPTLKFVAKVSFEGGLLDDMERAAVFIRNDWRERLESGAAPESTRGTVRGDRSKRLVSPLYSTSENCAILPDFAMIRSLEEDKNCIVGPALMHHSGMLKVAHFLGYFDHASTFGVTLDGDHSRVEYDMDEQGIFDALNYAPIHWQLGPATNSL